MKHILSICALSFCLTACLYPHSQHEHSYSYFNDCACNKTCQLQTSCSTCFNLARPMPRKQQIIIVLPTQATVQEKKVIQQEIIYPEPESCVCKKDCKKCKRKSK